MEAELRKDNLNPTTNLIYSLTRYLEDQSPMSLYIPNKPLLFKMMKACVGVNRIEELWIYQESDSALLDKCMKRGIHSHLHFKREKVKVTSIE